MYRLLCLCSLILFAAAAVDALAATPSSACQPRAGPPQVHFAMVTTDGAPFSAWAGNITFARWGGARVIPSSVQERNARRSDGRGFRLYGFGPHGAVLGNISVSAIQNAIAVTAWVRLLTADRALIAEYLVHPMAILNGGTSFDVRPSTRNTRSIRVSSMALLHDQIGHVYVREIVPYNDAGDRLTNLSSAAVMLTRGTLIPANAVLSDSLSFQHIDPGPGMFLVDIGHDVAISTVVVNVLILTHVRGDSLVLLDSNHRVVSRHLVSSLYFAFRATLDVPWDCLAPESVPTEIVNVIPAVTGYNLSLREIAAVSAGGTAVSFYAPFTSTDDWHSARDKEKAIDGDDSTALVFHDNPGHLMRLIAEESDGVALSQLTVLRPEGNTAWEMCRLDFADAEGIIRRSFFLGGDERTVLSGLEVAPTPAPPTVPPVTQPPPTPPPYYTPPSSSSSSSASASAGAAPGSSGVSRRVSSSEDASSSAAPVTVAPLASSSKGSTGSSTSGSQSSGPSRSAASSFKRGPDNQDPAPPPMTSPPVVVTPNTPAPQTPASEASSGSSADSSSVAPVTASSSKDSKSSSGLSSSGSSSAASSFRRGPDGQHPGPPPMTSPPVIIVPTPQTPASSGSSAGDDSSNDAPNDVAARSSSSGASSSSSSSSPSSSSAEPKPSKGPVGPNPKPSKPDPPVDTAAPTSNASGSASSSAPSNVSADHGHGHGGRSSSSSTSSGTTIGSSKASSGPSSGASSSGNPSMSGLPSSMSIDGGPTSASSASSASSPVASSSASSSSSRGGNSLNRPSLSAPAPDTPAPSTPAPETPTPETPAPDTPVPETPAPDTPAPETAVPSLPGPHIPGQPPNTTTTQPASSSSVPMDTTLHVSMHLPNETMAARAVKGRMDIAGAVNTDVAVALPGYRQLEVAVTALRQNGRAVGYSVNVSGAPTDRVAEACDDDSFPHTARLLARQVGIDPKIVDVKVYVQQAPTNEFDSGVDVGGNAPSPLASPLLLTAVGVVVSAVFVAGVVAGFVLYRHHTALLEDADAKNSKAETSSGGLGTSNQSALLTQPHVAASPFADRCVPSDFGSSPDFPAANPLSDYLRPRAARALGNSMLPPPAFTGIAPDSRYTDMASSDVAESVGSTYRVVVHVESLVPLSPMVMPASSSAASTLGAPVVVGGAVTSGDGLESAGAAFSDGELRAMMIELPRAPGRDLAAAAQHGRPLMSTAGPPRLTKAVLEARAVLADSSDGASSAPSSAASLAIPVPGVDFQLSPPRSVRGRSATLSRTVSAE